MIGFVTGVTSKIAFGQADSDKYDELGNMLTGGTLGALYGDWDPKWPYNSDNDSIFGRFEDLKINELPPEVQNTKNGFFKVSYYPNLNSGKMNFHFYEIFDFINTLDRIWKN